MSRRNRTNQQQASTTMSEEKALDTELSSLEQEGEMGEEMDPVDELTESTDQQSSEEGQEEPPVAPEEEAPAVVTQEPVAQPSPATVQPQVTQEAPAVVVENDPLAFLKGRLKTYAEKMNKRNVWDVKVGVSQQRLLLDTINSTFRMDVELFVPAWQCMVEFAKANRSDCFGDLYVFRGFADLGLVDTIRKRAEFLIQFILVSADTSIAKAASMTNVDHLSTRGLTSAEVERLMLLFPGEQ